MAGLEDLLISQSTNLRFLGPEALRVTVGLELFWVLVAKACVDFKLLKVSLL